MKGIRCSKNTLYQPESLIVWAQAVRLHVNTTDDPIECRMIEGIDDFLNTLRRMDTP